MQYISLSEAMRITNDVLMKNTKLDNVQSHKIIQSYLAENPIRSGIDVSGLNI